MNIVGFDVGLVSTSDALVAFYEDALGCERLEPRVFPFATVHRLGCGPVTLKVMVPAEPPRPPIDSPTFWAVGGIRYLTLWLDDLDTTIDRWTRAGGVVTTAPIEIRPGVRTALLADPDGNVIEAMQST